MKKVEHPEEEKEPKEGPSFPLPATQKIHEAADRFLAAIRSPSRKSPASKNPSKEQSEGLPLESDSRVAKKVKQTT